MENKTAAQAQMLVNRLQKRFRHLKKWALRTKVDFFRLYDRDIPEIPLVLDFYGDLTKADTADWAICGSLYKRPYEKDESEEELWLSVMKDSIAKTMGINAEHIFIKERLKQKGLAQYEKISKEQFTKVISEASLLFKVNFSDYLDTGLFLDRRLLRQMIKNEAAGKKVLNLFSYTGAFSVYCAAGGALSTDSVDLSNTYLNWAQENFTLNKMSCTVLQQWDFFDKNRISANNLIRADVLDFLGKAAAAKLRWDLIILDPPAFSNSKKMTDTFDLNRDLTEIVLKCLNLLAPGGKIFLSINLRRSVPSCAELETTINASLKETRRKESANVRVRDLAGKILDEDFMGRKVPRAYVVERVDG